MNTFPQERLDRAVRRRLLKEDEAWIGKPLPANPPLRAAQAHVRHLATMLLDTHLEHRAVQAAIYAGNLFDATLAQQKKGQVACSKGCHYCCTKLVMVTLPDIFRLAQSIHGNTAKIAEVAAAAVESRIITRNQQRNHRLPCAVLTDKACSAYADRPIPCRFLLSKSVESCVRIFQENTGEAFPYTDGTVDVRQRFDQIVQAALLVAGLPPYHFELIQALAVALTQDRAEERWLAGEPLFADVAVNANDFKNPAMSGFTEKLAADIRPTI